MVPVPRNAASGTTPLATSLMADSRKSALRRWAARSATRAAMLVLSIVSSTRAFPTWSSSMTIVPENALRRPLAVVSTMRFIANAGTGWTGS